MRTLLLLLSLLYSSSALAQMSVQVLSTADDPVGARLVYALKEQIRQSSSLKLSLDPDEMGLQANIVTLEQNPRQPGNSTVYSLVITWHNPQIPFPYLINQYTGYCGSDRVRSCAENLVAEISDTSDKLVQLANRASER